MSILIEDVFVTEGVPEYTFISPPNMNEIMIDIRRKGKPVIIEGQSGTGKTTCVKKILEKLGKSFGALYLSARKPADIIKINDIVEKSLNGIFVLDDFHRLPADLQENLANIAKLSAEEEDSSKYPKLIIIGINQVGTTLIQLVPDIAKRIGIHKIQQATKEKTIELVNRGCCQLGIRIEKIERIYDESNGDYWLTQQLSQSICTMNDVTEKVDAEIVIDFELDDLRGKVIEKLKSSYNEAVKEFCRGRRFRPSNDPYFKLLKAIGEQESSIVNLNELANIREDIRGSINNIKEKRIGILLDSKPLCARHFFYNQDTKYFAIEDPALFYFLKYVNWEQIQADCGFRFTEKDYEFDFALSFAGENRELASFIDEQLRIMDSNVFYDENFESNYLGKTWTEQFKRIFSRDSRLVVCFLDINHKNKIWPSFEREIFRTRVTSEEVIPIYLDNTVFLGIPEDLVGIKFGWDQTSPSWKDTAIDEIVFKLLEKLN